jgi:hypothetical protein
MREKFLAGMRSILLSMRPLGVKATVWAFAELLLSRLEVLTWV